MLRHCIEAAMESIRSQSGESGLDPGSGGIGGPPRWGGGRAIVGPVAILAASLLVALAIYFGFLGSSWVDWVARWTASWTSVGLNVFGFSTTANGTILASEGFAVSIVAECTAVGPLVLFMGAVAAYPSPMKSKGFGLLLGAVVLTAVNLFRIMSLFWIGSNYPEYLDIAHLLVWQSVIILLAILLWLFWVDRLAGVRNA
ncbi:MAG: hypothetical protein FI707_10990 [SAR202 cluster bacterium]|jgi:exosortase/archaeosortase family protein|nr:hypothetical protein [Chloroflexota bacterium]MQG58638.1 hypothetical protein [SAR202 cluster bacterium]MQG69302.1 hypothetical protein [SAR202 cluster bacterium]HAL47106.1 hypothetical protein [Dehalococcoidia bacterium]|tara:strand:- start:346 stop:945 length:600 start_codon:yes stop_codon:yes gene_type:complete